MINLLKNKEEGKMKMEFSGTRRTFIKGVTIFGGLSLLLGLGGRSQAKRREQPPPQPEQSAQGYRLTEHIKKYYETARS
jgi:hypothetical protein